MSAERASRAAMLERLVQFDDLSYCPGDFSDSLSICLNLMVRQSRAAQLRRKRQRAIFVPGPTDAGFPSPNAIQQSLVTRVQLDDQAVRGADRVRDPLLAFAAFDLEGENQDSNPQISRIGPDITKVSQRHLFSERISVGAGIGFG